MSYSSPQSYQSHQFESTRLLTFAYSSILGEARNHDVLLFLLSIQSCMEVQRGWELFQVCGVLTEERHLKSLSSLSHLLTLSVFDAASWHLLAVVQILYRDQPHYVNYPSGPRPRPSSLSRRLHQIWNTMCMYLDGPTPQCPWATRWSWSLSPRRYEMGVEKDLDECKVDAMDSTCTGSHDLEEC